MVMKLQTKLKWIQGVKLFLIIISVLTLVNIITDYDDINDQYVQKKEQYELLKLLHQRTLDFYKIDLSSNENLSSLSKMVLYQEIMIDSEEHNNELISYYYYILFLGGWIMAYVINALNKKEEVLKKRTEVISNETQ